MRFLTLAGACVLAATLQMSAGHAQDASTGGDREAGRAFALSVCTSCHVVAPDQTAPSRFANAPAFRTIANMPSTTAMSLNAFLRSPHPNMPNLVLSRDEAADVIAYILGLRDRP